MNWNGRHKNDVLGNVSSCRETIAVTKQRGSSSPGASWLLEKVDPEENRAAIISLVSSLDQWAGSLHDIEREKWLLWAMTRRPIEVLQWMGYADDWTMMPAAVSKNQKVLVRLAQPGRLPFAYLIPGEPRESDVERLGITLVHESPDLYGVELATVTYARYNSEWYKVHYPKYASKSAVTRAIRLFLLGVLVGRNITSTTDLMMYELTGIKSWMLYGNGDMVSGIARHAGDTLFHLLLEPELMDIGS